MTTAPSDGNDRAQHQEKGERRRPGPVAHVVAWVIGWPIIIPAILIRVSIRAPLVGVALLWSTISICLSIRTHCWEWFARSGAIVTLAGAWLSGRVIWKTAKA